MLISCTMRVMTAVGRVSQYLTQQQRSKTGKRRRCEFCSLSKHLLVPTQRPTAT